jgi:hypothetical protein
MPPSVTIFVMWLQKLQALICSVDGVGDSDWYRGQGKLKTTHPALPTKVENSPQRSF